MADSPLGSGTSASLSSLTSSSLKGRCSSCALTTSSRFISSSLSSVITELTADPRFLSPASLTNESQACELTGTDLSLAIMSFLRAERNVSSFVRAAISISIF